MPCYESTYGTKPENGTENLSLHQMESALRGYLAHYHQTVNSETGLSPLTFWEDHFSPQSADPYLLATLLGEGNARTVTSKERYYRRWKDWHDSVSSYSKTKVLIYTDSYSSPGYPYGNTYGEFS